MNAVAEPLPIKTRRMRDPDVPEVMATELAAYPHPWTDGIFRDCIRVGYYCVVGEVGGQVMAHAVMSVAAGEAHVLNLCVHPGWQGRGFGRRMLDHLIDTARGRVVTHMFLEVRASNEVAQGLYLSQGFNEIAQRPGYYPADEGRETALIFAKTLRDSSAGDP